MYTLSTHPTPKARETTATTTPDIVEVTSATGTKTNEPGGIVALGVLSFTNGEPFRSRINRTSLRKALGTASPSQAAVPTANAVGRARKLRNSAKYESGANVRAT